MYKIKTKSGASKRFKITKTGKIIRRHQNARHLRAAKSKAHIRRMKEPDVISRGFAKSIKAMINN